jgi:hypothetical protein
MYYSLVKEEIDKNYRENLEEIIRIKNEIYTKEEQR